jgi:hypothetical protein
VPRLIAGVEGQIKSKLIHVKSQTALLIANENVYEINREIGPSLAGRAG